MNTHNTRLNKEKNARRGNRSRESAIDEERGPTIGKYRGRRLRIARPKSREFFIWSRNQMFDFYNVSFAPRTSRKEDAPIARIRFDLRPRYSYSMRCPQNIHTQRAKTLIGN